MQAGRAGHCSFHPPPAPPLPPPRREHPTGDEVEVRLKQTSRLSQACAAYCRAKSLPLPLLKFLYRGARVDSTGVLDVQTARSMAMGDGDVVDVFHL
jgi:hypothetical protein